MSYGTQKNEWRSILAALGNKGSRKMFARIEIEGVSNFQASRFSRKDRAALARLVSVGLVVNSGDQYSINVDNIRALVSDGSADSEQRKGLQRFMNGQRIQSLPKNPDQRRELLKWVAGQIISSGESVDEKTINDRLAKFHPDVAMLRRYMVDEEIVSRSLDGSEYRV